MHSIRRIAIPGFVAGSLVASMTIVASVGPALASSRSSADIPRVDIPATDGGYVEVLDETVLFPPTPNAYFGTGIAYVETSRQSGGDPHINVTQDPALIDCGLKGRGVLEASYTTYGSRFVGTVALEAFTNVTGLDQGPLDQDPALGVFKHVVHHDTAPNYDGAPNKKNIVKICLPTFQ